MPVNHYEINSIRNKFKSQPHNEWDMLISSIFDLSPVILIIACAAIGLALFQ